ncbi:hypothetical protein [Streptomyces aurantiogriseus]|nr:hypothetical protein [Streptomyces aurantiogriseus]
MAQPEHGPGQRRTDPVTDEEKEEIRRFRAAAHGRNPIGDQ